MSDQLFDMLQDEFDGADADMARRLMDLRIEPSPALLARVRAIPTSPGSQQRARLAWGLVIGLLLLILGAGFLAGNPTVQAQIRKVLRWIAVGETDQIPQPYYPEGKQILTPLPTPGPLRRAQARTTFHILQPDHLPAGYRFSGAATWDIYERAVDSAVLLYYSGPQGGFVIEEYEPLYKLREAIAEGQGREIEVGGNPAIYIDGRWEVTEDGAYTGWTTGDSQRLLYEMGDVAIHIYESGILSPDELVQIAESLR